MSTLISAFPVTRVCTAVAAFLIASGTLVGVAHAQPAAPPAPAERPAERQQRPGGRVFEQLQQTIQSLGLSADQAQQVREIVRTARQDMQSKMQDAQTMEPRDRAAMMRDTLTDLETKIGGVLTPEQKKTFDARVEEMNQQIQATAAGQNRRNANADGGTTQPSTRPAGAANGGEGGRGGQLMARVERALEAAEVTPEQKAKIEPILADARTKMLAIVADNTGDPQAMREKIREARQDVQAKMADILTPAQQEKFRAAMQPAGGGRRGQDTPPADKPAGGMTPPDQPTTMPADKPADKPAAMAPADNSTIAHMGEAGKTGLSLSPVATSAPTSTKLAIGDALPPFSLLRLDGRAVNNKSLAGKPSVVVFGSYTAASFRDRVPQLQQLAKRFGSRVNWLIIYTRELHPSDAADQPERNRDEKIEVAKHKSVPDRTAAARLARTTLEITLDVVPDTLDDAFTTALDGFPNASLVFDADGLLVARQNWADPFAIERALQAAFAQAKQR